MRLLAGRTVDARGEKQGVAIEIERGRIVGLSPWDRNSRPENGDVEVPDGMLCPGFIDIHVHGGAGRAVMEGTDEALHTVALHLAAHGVTGFLSTTITAPWEQQSAALAAAARAMHRREPDSAAVLGCHLEGPYINPKRKGAQPERYILPPDIDDFRFHVGEYLPAVKIVTLAPEMDGALPLVQYLAGAGIVASIGHTNATYQQVRDAVDSGARHLTHCFNAMRPMESREPGVVGAAMALPELQAELIWDKEHVHPASCRALVAAKGTQGVILISDGIPGAGMGEGYEFSLGDETVRVSNGTARLPDGVLAGSVLTMDVAFRNAACYTPAERTRMTSHNAAIALGLGHRKGLIVAGYDADFAVLDGSGRVLQTWMAGELAYDSAAR